jgi:hypothetical protein
MVKRSESDWRDLIQRHHDSGLSANAFCKQNKLCPKYFSLRKKQLRHEGQSKIVRPPFMTAKVSSTPSSQNGIMLSYQGTVLTIPCSVNERWLANLLKALA